MNITVFWLCKVKIVFHCYNNRQIELDIKYLA